MPSEAANPAVANGRGIVALSSDFVLQFFTVLYG
jgi:hypothetical protein